MEIDTGEFKIFENIQHSSALDIDTEKCVSSSHIELLESAAGCCFPAQCGKWIEHLRRRNLYIVPHLEHQVAFASIPKKILMKMWNFIHSKSAMNRDGSWMESRREFGSEKFQHFLWFLWWWGRNFAFWERRWWGIKLKTGTRISPVSVEIPWNSDLSCGTEFARSSVVINQNYLILLVE